MSRGRDDAAGTARRDRLQSIQVLRGVAAVLVLTTHACNLVFAADSATGPFLVGSLGQFRGFGAVGVDLFFLISGFVMAFSVAGKGDGPRGAGYFLRLRWIRIAPPYLLVTAVLTVALATLGEFGWRGLANAVLFVPVVDTASYSIPPLSIGWTLSFEFSFYLLITLAVLLRQSHRIHVVAIGIAALVGIGLLWPDAPYLVRWFTNPIFLEFALGIGAYLLWRHGALARARILWGLLGVAGAAALILGVVVGFGGIADMHRTLSGELSMQRVLVWGLPCLAVFLACVSWWRGLGDGPAGRAAAGVGDASYSIYLVHLPFFLLIGKGLEISGLPVPSDALFVIAVLVGIGAGLVYYRIVERPVTRRLRQRVSGSARSAATSSGTGSPSPSP